MAYRELELTLLSARDLKNVNLFTRMDVYAVASISGDPMTRQCTPTDTSSGRNPSWNTTVRFSVPPSAAEAGSRWVHVLLRSERALGDRDIGEVVVPLAELLATADGPGKQPPWPASYQVHTVHRGEPRGVLNVSYRLGPVVAPVERAVMAYPAPQQPIKHQYHDAYASPRKPFTPQNPAAPQQPFKQQNPAPPQPYHPPHDAYAPRRHEEALSPANGKSNGHGPTQVYMGPQTQIIIGGSPPPTPRPNSIPAKANEPKPSYTPTQPNPAPAKTDHSWPKPSCTPTQPNPSAVKTDHSWPKPHPQYQDTQATWPNASPKKPIQQETRAELAHTQSKVVSGKTTDDHSWPKPYPQHQETQATRPKPSPEKPIQQNTRAGELAHHTPSKNGSSGRTAADHSARPQQAPLKEQDSNTSARKTSAATQVVGGYGSSVQSNNHPAGKTESRHKEAYANSMTGGKADHPSGPKAVLQQHERVHSMPTATAR